MRPYPEYPPDPECDECGGEGAGPERYACLFCHTIEWRTDVRWWQAELDRHVHDYVTYSDLINQLEQTYPRDVMVLDEQVGEKLVREAITGNPEFYKLRLHQEISRGRAVAAILRLRELGCDEPVPSQVAYFTEPADV